jgi:hypothetical protein
MQEMVPIKSAGKSKINRGEVVKVIVGMLAVFGVVVPEGLEKEAVALWMVAGAIYTIVMRTWFNRTVTPEK